MWKGMTLPTETQGHCDDGYKKQIGVSRRINCWKRLSANESQRRGVGVAARGRRRGGREGGGEAGSSVIGASLASKHIPRCHGEVTGRVNADFIHPIIL